MVNYKKNRKHVIFLFSVIFLFVSGLLYWFYFLNKEKILGKILFSKNTYSTIFGNIDLKEEIIFDAISNNALLRMKKVDQGGPGVYFNYALPFSRYDHCLGVWALIRRYGGSIEEQLVGLYHDISHTAFSHVADFIFTEGEKGEHSYQDSIHLWYIENTDAIKICKKYNLPVTLLDPDNGNYKMLERSLPDMCADRIEYNLHTAYVYSILSQEEIQNILNHLHYETVTYYKNNELITEKNWFFDDILHAKKFALLPIHFIKSIWNSPWSMICYKIFSAMIRYAFMKKYITKNDFHFGSDLDILNKLYDLNDPYILYMFDLLHNLMDNFEIITKEGEKYDFVCKGKFRGIDPLVQLKDAKLAQRLTELDFDFKNIYNLSKIDAQQGYKVKLKKPYQYEDVII